MPGTLQYISPGRVKRRYPPTGTVTFLFTDIEGSTRLWEQYPGAMHATIARHDDLLREVIESNGGYVFKTVGDAFCAAFPTAPHALSAALAAQCALNAEEWGQAGPIKVRMALHTGAAEARGGDYFGLPLNRVARLLSIAHGGQVLLSLATQQLVRDHLPPDTDLKDLGEGSLKDLARPEHVYQLLAPGLPGDFPPLRSLDVDYMGLMAGTEARLLLKNPYKGLRAFQEADAHDFFGREALTERLVARLGERVESARFLAVVGPSGSGKSSVLRAGLVPALKQGALPGSQSWIVAEMLPGAHPLERLEATLLNIADHPPDNLLEQLREDERGLMRAVKRALPAGEAVELALVIDQFEEIFTLVEDEAERAHFLNSLCAAVADPNCHVRVIIALRADFYDRPMLYARFGNLVCRRDEVVLPLTGEELEQAIAGPAAPLGVMPEAELVATMLRDVSGQPGALPLLQYALTELFEQRMGRTMTLEAYRASGGVPGALSRRAEEIYATLTGAERALTRQVFLRLVTLGEGVDDTRRRVRLPELESLASQAGNEQMLAGVLEVFGRYRLLTFDRDPVTGGPMVEVAHEALLHTWKRLGDWLESSREDLGVHRRLLVEASEWARAGRNRSYLAAGAQLAQFEVLAAKSNLKLNEEEMAYLQASLVERDRQEAAERLRQVRELALQKRAATLLRYLVGVLGVSLLVTGGLAIWALTQNKQAEANSNSLWAMRLVARANRLLQTPGNAEAFTLLSIRSVRTQYSHEGDDALAAAMNLDLPGAAQGPKAHAGFPQFTGHKSEVNSMSFAPGGGYVLTGSGDKTARLWDAQTGDLKCVLSRHTSAVAGVAFSSDGNHMLIGTEDGEVGQGQWDPQKGTCLYTRFPLTYGQTLRGIVFSPDDRSMLTTSADGRARLWDVPTGVLSSTFVLTGSVGRVADSSNGKYMITSAAFSPNGKKVLAGGSYVSADGSERYGVAQQWNAHTGDSLITYPRRTDPGHTDPVTSVAYSSDGGYVLTGSKDRTARLWDADTGVTKLIFIGPTSGVTSVTFSSVDSYVLAGSEDGTVWLWDRQSGELLRSFSAHTGLVSALAFSPDGKYLFTGGDDVNATGRVGTARLWYIKLDDTIKYLCGRLRRDFSSDERFQYSISDKVPTCR